MIEYHGTAEMLAWAENKIGLGSFGSDARAIGRRRDRKLVAVAVFGLFEPWGCEVAFAAERHWFCRDYTAAVFAYPFLQLGVERVTCRVAANNRPARMLVRALGFVPEGRQRRLDPENDRLMFGMLRSECRWIPLF